MVFAITPASIASEICEWEIATSDQLGKKLIPVVPAPLQQDVAPPERLARLNYIFFFADPNVPGSGFGKGLGDLCTALRTDLDWVRAHTRYGQRAAEWLRGDRVNSRLLSGSDVAAAKRWLSDRQPDAPEITNDIHEFIDASEQLEIERNSAERKRLQEKEAELEKTKVAQAQTAKAQWLAKIYLTAGLILAATFVAIALSFRNEARRAEQRAQGYVDLAGWIGKKILRDSGREPTDAQIAAMIDLCNEAVRVTREIADSQESIDPSLKQKFENMYEGSLYVVELFEKHHIPEKEIKIEAAMVNFGRIMSGGQGVTNLGKYNKNLDTAAQGVEDACGEFMRWLANEYPGSSAG